MEEDKSSEDDSVINDPSPDKQNSEDFNGGGKVKLNLGDIIQLVAPSHEKIHEQTFFVEYLDESQIVLLDVISLTNLQLNLDTEGYLTDEYKKYIY